MTIQIIGRILQTAKGAFQSESGVTDINDLVFVAVSEGAIKPFQDSAEKARNDKPKASFHPGGSYIVLGGILFFLFLRLRVFLARGNTSPLTPFTQHFLQRLLVISPDFFVLFGNLAEKVFLPFLEFVGVSMPRFKRILPTGKQD